ncbi:hypothetical protein DSO57_1037413 [Entomophthora muscae]|uniref:Uncharacterized protein n=1 Tax=Entomophthora muscae TaxID=34485 RepID=A0ACC2U815_9FUNG|nr:hypothetical protein DSO57_1037413 [Entomophthora muscae]
MSTIFVIDRQEHFQIAQRNQVSFKANQTHQKEAFLIKEGHPQIIPLSKLQAQPASKVPTKRVCDL